MDISLTPIQRRLIEKLMKTGQHNTATQVIDAALQQMVAREGQPDVLASLAGQPGPGGSEDIEALAFVVMMEAAKSAQADLKSGFGGVGRKARDRGMPGGG
jgi:hypothetical protein